MTPHDEKHMQDNGNCLRSGAIGRPRKGEAEQRRSHLISVATKLFLEKGYYRVSLAMIAQEARVAVRTIYLGFGGKAGIFSAALKQGRERFMTDEQALDPTGPIAEVLGNFGLSYLHYLADPQIAKLRRMAMTEASISPDLEQAWKDAGPAVTHGQLTRYFSDVRVQSQIYPDIPLDLLPVYFMACVAGEHGWPRVLATGSAGSRTLRQLLDARMVLFANSVLMESPRNAAHRPAIHNSQCGCAVRHCLNG